MHYSLNANCNKNTVIPNYLILIAHYNIKIMSYPNYLILIYSLNLYIIKIKLNN